MQIAEFSWSRSYNDLKFIRLRFEEAEDDPLDLETFTKVTTQHLISSN